MRLAFLHTAEAHVATFGALVGRLAPGLTATHAVDASLLADAVARGGVTGDLVGRLERALAASRAELVVCTCSTIGGAAEAAGRRLGLAVVRIDRAMAERAVAAADRILVAACLASTVAPTLALLDEVAAGQGRRPVLRSLVVAGAWDRFLAGDLGGYARAVADGLRSHVGDADLVVLAQASMAPAAALCADLGLPILSSPEPGVADAIARLASA